MLARGVTYVCDLCGSSEDVNTVRIRIPPDTAVETDLCTACQLSATAVEVIDAGRNLRSGRPLQDVEMLNGELL
jgi:hypothetical protein